MFCYILPDSPDYHLKSGMIECSRHSIQKNISMRGYSGLEFLCECVEKKKLQKCRSSKTLLLVARATESTHLCSSHDYLKSLGEIVISWIQNVFKVPGLQNEGENLCLFLLMCECLYMQTLPTEREWVNSERQRHGSVPGCPAGLCLVS